MALPKSPTWIYPWNPPVPLVSLSAIKDGVRKIMWKDSFPKPDCIINEVYLWNKKNITFNYMNLEEKELIQILNQIDTFTTAFGKISFMNREHEDTFVIILDHNVTQPERTRTYLRIANYQQVLDNPLLLCGNDKLEELEWEIAEKKFNEYQEIFKQNHQQKIENAIYKRDQTVQQYLTFSKEVEMLQAISISFSTKSIKTEIEAIKQISLVSSISFKEGMIQVDLKPIQITYKEYDYFIGEFRLSFINKLPVIENLSLMIDNRYHHPHITKDSACWGTYKEVLLEMLDKRDFFQLTQLIISYLVKYNSKSPYCGIDRFPVFKEGVLHSSPNVKWLKEYPQWGVRKELDVQDNEVLPF